VGLSALGLSAPLRDQLTFSLLMEDRSARSCSGNGSTVLPCMGGPRSTHLSPCGCSRALGSTSGKPASIRSARGTKRYIVADTVSGDNDLSGLPRAMRPPHFPGSSLQLPTGETAISGVESTNVISPGIRLDSVRSVRG